MIFLYIILGILLLLFLISLIRVQVFAQYTDTLTLTLKILFFKIKLIPPPEKKEKEEKPKKEKPKKKPKKKEPEKKKDEEKKPSFLATLKEKHGLSGLVSLFTSLAKIAAGMLRNIVSHIVIKKFDVGIALSGEDAASVAVNYGKLCSALYPSINVITSMTACKSYHIVVEPMFDPEMKTEVFADIYLYLRIIFVLAAAISAGVKAGIKVLSYRFKK